MFADNFPEDRLAISRHLYVWGVLPDMMLIVSMSYASVVLKPEWPFPVSRVSDRWSHHCRGQRNGVSKKDIFLISFVKSSCQALDLCVSI
jgi:hypothetical protein